jgi:multiple sugar transport system ATP-binding protein
MEIELQNLTKTFGDLVAVDDMSMTFGDGEFTTLVGPSGCGKTTTLRCLAGLESPTEGRILFDGEEVTAASPDEREIAFVFQDYALYPHMTARKNMSFALEHGTMTKAEIDEKVSAVAEMLGIYDHLDNKPGDLSGGQQQRVALGRSIVRDPDVFLLDEPLANLDASLRVEMRAELQKLHKELDVTMVYVTHDQEEAMTMSDKIAVLNDGHLQQFSEPETAYNQPENQFVAEFIGNPSINVFQSADEGNVVRVGPFTLDAPDGVEGSIARGGVRPEDFTLETDPTDGAAATVKVFEQLGAFNLVYLAVDGVPEDVVVQVPASTHVGHGDEVALSIQESRIYLFDESGDTVHSPTLHSERVNTPSGGPV